MNRFKIGTSGRWPGACVFWYIDELSRVRGGQIKQFDSDWHTVKYVDGEGKTRNRVSWAHSALIRKLEAENKPIPEWLTTYDEHAERSPCLFGLPQLREAPIDQPIAVCEAPKTAILATAYFPDFLWLAAGALSYLTPERMAPLRGKSVTLFPDASTDGTAFAKWSKRADELNAVGYRIKVSDFMENNTTPGQKAKGFDLADFILTQYEGYPPSWDSEPDAAPNIALVESHNSAEWSNELNIKPGQVLRPVPIHRVG